MTEGRERDVELIAHRFGNHAGLVEQVAEVVDTIEIDVWLDRGAVVVRHAHRVPFGEQLWERRGLFGFDLLDPEARARPYAETVAEIGPDLGLWIDCKGPGRRLPRRALAAAGHREGVTVSSKAWWALGTIDKRRAGYEGVRVIRSVGNRFELALLLRLPSRVMIDGVVAHRRLLEKGGKGLVETLLERYGTLFSWSIDDAATGRLLASWGVQGLIIDDPEVMDELRRLP